MGLSNTSCSTLLSCLLDAFLFDNGGVVGLEDSLKENGSVSIQQGRQEVCTLL